MANPEIITRSRRCRQVSSELLRESVIAVDAEGVQLGKDGPMTLLQIGTMAGQVYLFDIQENGNLFTKGRLATVLESEKVIKVIHSCSGDSAALFFQFDVKLRNVFDTQVAHLVIEEGRGRRLPRLLKLEMICQTYSTTSTVAENKDEMAKLWTKEESDLWAKRPLSEEMIKYAAGDVTAIVPEVYETQLSQIEQQGQMEKFQKRVDEEILYHIDENMQTQRRERAAEIVDDIIEDMDEKYDSDTTFDDITDEDEKAALKRLRSKKKSPLINRLKRECTLAQLDELEGEVTSKGDDLRLNWNVSKFLFAMVKHEDDDIREKAEDLRGRVNDILLRDIGRKYSIDTPLNEVSKGDIDTLRSMRPKRGDDPQYDEVQLHLYWTLMVDDIEEHLQAFKEKGKDYRVKESYFKRLKYFATRDARVPIAVKRKARQLLQDLEKCFGKNKIPVKK